MSSASRPAPSAGRGPLVIVLAIIGVLGILAGILYISGAANSLHFMASVHKGHHAVRAIVSLVVGVAFLVGAYFARSRPGPAAASSGPAGTPAATAGGPGSAASETDTGNATTSGS